MKKTLYIIGAIILSVVSLTSCEEELMDYEGESALYFDVRLYPSHIDKKLWPHRLSTEVTFGNVMEDDLEVVIPVRTTGVSTDYDRPYKVEVVADSTTARLDIDFSDLQTDRVIKAGQTSDTIRFKAHRTDEIFEDTVRLQIRLLPNEHFITNFKEYGEPGSYFSYVTVGGSQSSKEFDVNADASIHNIFIYDTMTQPMGWWGSASSVPGIGGGFTAKKIRLMMKLCECDLSAFDTKYSMPSSRFTSYCEKLGRYLIEQAKLGPDHVVLENDGTLMWVSFCSSGDSRYRWGQGVTLDQVDFYKKQ